jgi:hypothetical protein
MHVASFIEPADLGLIPSLIVVIANVTRLLHIFDTVNQEQQGEPSILDRLGLVFDDEPKLVDLIDDTAHCRSGKPGVIFRPVARGVHVVPEGRRTLPRLVPRNERLRQSMGKCNPSLLLPGCAQRFERRNANVTAIGDGICVSKRARRFELLTSSLGSWHSTTELRPQVSVAFFGQSLVRGHDFSSNN